MEITRLLIEQNKYWQNPELINDDLHLCKLAKERRIIHPVETVDFGSPGIYTILGPRQIGKTTFLKTRIRALLHDQVSPKDILYFALDIGGVTTAEALKEVIKTFLEMSSKEKDRLRYIFLDEVTYARDWDVGLKICYDLGLFQNAVVIATGSSAYNIKKGRDKLPGRRGLGQKKHDNSMGPLRFREFLKATSSISVKQVSIHNPKTLFDGAKELSIHYDSIQKSLADYVRCGGIPFAINHLLGSSNSIVMDEIYSLYVQGVIGDVLKLNKRELYLREIVSALFEKRFEPVNNIMLSQISSIGSHSTVEEYIEILEGIFVLNRIFSAQNINSTKTSFRRRRKHYFLDPVYLIGLKAWSEGITDLAPWINAIFGDPQWVGKVIENVVAVHLRQICNKVLYWRGSKEIDFLCVLEGNRIIPCEVKYQKVITSHDKKALKNMPQGLIISRETLKWDNTNSIAIIPAGLFLAMV